MRPDSIARRTLLAAVEFVFFSPRSLKLQAYLLKLSATVVGKRRAAASQLIERIVIIKIDRIGDFVLLVPFLRELRRSRPNAWITLVTSQAALPLARLCPYVTEVLPAPATQRGPKSSFLNWIQCLSFAWKNLLPLRATIAVMARWDVDLDRGFALLALTAAKQTFGYSANVSAMKASRNRGADCLLTNVVSDAQGRHEVEKNLGLARALHANPEDHRLEIWTKALDQSVIDRVLQKRSSRILVGICPVSAEALKDWPFDRFIRVVSEFRDKPDITFLLFAGPEYASISNGDAVRALPNLISLAGQLTLEETTAWLGKCHLVLSVDTGLMHIAAALDRPLVVICGWPTGADDNSHYAPARFGPWRARAEILRPTNCDGSLRPIDGVSVEQVVASLTRHLIAT